MELSVHQTSRHLLREALRGVLLAAVGPERGSGGIGSVPCRVSAALYALLTDHFVDRWGRCRRCRRGPRRLFGRRRRVCRVLVAARFYLHQTDEVLLCRHLAGELDEAALAPGTAVDPEATDVLPQLADDPAVLPPPARTLTTAGPGSPPPCRPRPRRAPPGTRARPPSGGHSLMLTEGVTGQA